MRKPILTAFICLLLFIATSCSTAMKVGYSHKPFAAEGCNVNYSIFQQSEDLFIIVSISSEDLVFIDTPTMKMRNFQGDIIELNGETLSTQSKNAGVLLFNIFLPITELKTMAQFKIEKNQIQFFEPGIQKVRISTVPLVHEKTFTSDIIGRWLYKKLDETLMVTDDF